MEEEKNNNVDYYKILCDIQANEAKELSKIIFKTKIFPVMEATILYEKLEYRKEIPYWKYRLISRIYDKFYNVIKGKLDDESSTLSLIAFTITLFVMDLDIGKKEFESKEIAKTLIYKINDFSKIDITKIDSKITEEYKEFFDDIYETYKIFYQLDSQIK
jgi:hypothetical protein